eukprot:2075879-Lingulodinium_polyedra.AAC.1
MALEPSPRYCWLCCGGFGPSTLRPTRPPRAFGLNCGESSLSFEATQRFYKYSDINCNTGHRQLM